MSRAHVQLRSASRRASVIVIVMVTVMFAAVALVAFMEKASVDLLVEQRESVTRRLRTEAYSALETTVAVLESFREVGNGLRSPAEGWGDPLAFAGYSQSEGRTVEIRFEDESGKISLPRANQLTLVNLFKAWGIVEAEAEDLADALLGWMKRDHVYTSGLSPNYEQGSLPFQPPARSLRSFHELAAIEKVREFFYDAEGRPNQYWKRFADSVSLFDFQRPNINGARADTLAAMGQFDPTQQQNLAEYLRGTGAYQNQGPGFFQSPNDAQRITGPTGDTAAFATTISALRIIVTVRDGRTEYKVATVIAPPNGATTVNTNATANRATTGGNAAQTASQQQNRPNATQTAAATAAQQNAATRNLRYPFTILEIRENDEIPPPPPPPDPLI